MSSNHTLLLLQKTPSIESRTFHDYDSVHQAVEGIIDLFETDLKNKSNSLELTYTDDQVYQFLDLFTDIVPLVNEPIHGGKLGYVPKDKQWIKTKIHEALMIRAKSTSTTSVSNLLSTKMKHLSMLHTPKLKNHIKSKQTSSRPPPPPPLPPPPPPTELMTKSFAERYKVPTSSSSSHKKRKRVAQTSTPPQFVSRIGTKKSVLGRLGKKSAPPKKPSRNSVRK
ncbi:hypothetical protein HMI54_014742 [Coelomomyces lativittatus]|nr:hypothetical protein HMI56_006456 [Coelomomyces lativittatus]KAJ1517807.1 hypothetical protein HMI55_005863 [Coelomomyces lativittatus]KAJ1518576.1 hypothetical protein HMI54_014742 [Coelomomyces lativittatus]